MRRYLSAFCMALTVMGAMAQNSYIVKTKGAKKAESTVTANEQAAEEATEEPTDFIGANFKNIKLCNWTEGMRFMVMPEKYDLVVGAFCDAKTNRDVSCGKLKHKIMVYKGHSVAKDGTALVNFHCEDDNNDYYYPIPNGTFDDYCYLKLGVPTLAYLGDVDKARELLMGSTLYTRTTEFFVDTDYDSDGCKEVAVDLNKEVKVVAIGVGTRSFPVKIIVEDSDGNQFFQNVAMSKTNCGMRDDEFIMKKTKNLFYGSFALEDAKKDIAESYNKYIGRHVYTKYAVDMIDLMGQKVRVPRLSQFTIKKIEPIDNSTYVKMSLQSAKDGYQYIMEVTFKNTYVAGDIDGKKENYYGFLFGEGAAGKNVSAKNMQLIRQGRIAKGFSKEEVRLAIGDPIKVVKNKNGITAWYYKNGNVVKFGKNGRKI